MHNDQILAVMFTWQFLKIFYSLIISGKLFSLFLIVIAIIMTSSAEQ